MTVNFRRSGKFSIIATVVFLGGLILAACQSGQPKISIESPHVVLSPAIYGEAMVTMTIKNEGGPDVLKGVSIDVPGAKAMIHLMEGQRMTQAATVDIPGGSSTEFKMGGSHVMLEDIPRTMTEGSPITVTLTFEKSGVKQLNLKLEKAPPMNMSGHMD
jgi:copper(I)-binding protein